MQNHFESFGWFWAILGHFGAVLGHFRAPVGLWKGPRVVQHDILSWIIPMESVLGPFGVIQGHFGSFIHFWTIFNKLEAFIAWIGESPICPQASNIRPHFHRFIWGSIISLGLSGAALFPQVYLGQHYFPRFIWGSIMERSKMMMDMHRWSPVMDECESASANPSSMLSWGSGL